MAKRGRGKKRAAAKKAAKTAAPNPAPAVPTPSVPPEPAPVEKRHIIKRCGSWCWHRRGVGTQMGIRLAAWGLGVFIALWPSVTASNASIGGLDGIAKSAIAAGHYRDFYFITVVAAVLGLTTTLVHIFKYNDGLADGARLVFGLLSFYFIGVAVVGVNRFADLAKLSAAQVPDLGLDLPIIYFTLAAGVVAEISVVLREHIP